VGMSTPTDDGAHPAVQALLAPAVAGITRLSATDTVRARIALAIELDLLASGEQLPADAEVAAALGVSEITARRALKSLADDGLLTRRRGRRGGTFVASPDRTVAIDAVTAYRADAAEVHKLIDRRVLLECTLTHHAALAATALQLDELDAFVREAASARNWTEYHAADEKLHLGVARAAGMPWALPYYVDALYGLYHYFIPYPVAYLHGVNQEHAGLVAALRERDPVAAVAIIEHHVSTLHRSMFVGLGDGQG
jgi:GntR family transcriptional regulator, transcriptional repressor for pyruvate dehydrogenase complex